LERENDISLEEADQMFSFAEALAEAITEEGALYVPVMENKLGQTFPASAIDDWYEAVAQKIKAGQSGNFVFSISFAYSPSRFYGWLFPAIEAIDEYGSFEDRVRAIKVNQKMLSLFPKYFLNSFEWEKRDGLYVLHGDRAGFYRYPRRNPENGKTYTISQLFKRILSLPFGDTTGKINSSSKTDKVLYVLKYLQQKKVPYMEIKTTNSLFWETTVHTSKEAALIAKKAMEVSFEELVENAVTQGVIDKDVAKELLKVRAPDRFIDTKFEEVSIKYIDDVVKRKVEWEVVKRAVEDEPEWIGEIR
jgi:hypothetical protein